MDDILIVDLFLKRDERALKETQSKYGSRLLRISENILKNLSEAEECENDTYLAAWKSMPPNSPKDYLFAYLAKIIRNLSLNVYKKNKRQKSNAMIIELSSEREYIRRVELIYRDESWAELYMPYYKFYVELPIFKRENGLNTYGAFYVPAVEGKYIKNMPLWDGSFN